jgi:6-phosphofructokinase
MQGAARIAEECIRRKLKITVAAIPKTIDNDIAYIDQVLHVVSMYIEFSHMLERCNVFS